ncbi:hypothetical protein [Bacteroides gallinaceum]|uniref:hypothetical protein n=1 Tax=Bacteroides gallinaceum TaxID=1462571 RepID=UPI0025AA767E|nr:hypothetical protein [Bacteroides gallinaceum]MDN0065943.1 hypothetical protein [Bacteroides gallinaceum]
MPSPSTSRTAVLLVLGLAKQLTAFTDISIYLTRVNAVQRKGVEADYLSRSTSTGEYALTGRSRSLLPHLNASIEWAMENKDAILTDRQKAMERK